MRNLINETCSRCRVFKPRCARVRLLLQGTSGKKYLDRPILLCPECRKEVGVYRVEPEHRPVPKARKPREKTLFDKVK